MIKLLESDEDSLDDMDMGDIDDIEVDESDSRLDEAQGVDDDAPIVKYINGILIDAVRKGASDLHFEPYEKKYRIRFSYRRYFKRNGHPTC